MPEIGRNNRLVYAIGVGLFGVALAAGIIQSLRTNGRLPAIDLVMNGSNAYVNRLLARDDSDKAIEQLQMQARILPYDADTHEQLGKLLRSQGRPEEALAHFQVVVRLRPKDEAYCHLGLTYLNMNQPDLAARSFTEAIHLNPQSSQAYAGLAFAAAQLGEVAEAQKCFAKAAELAPDPSEAKMLRKASEELRGNVKKGEPPAATDRPRE